MKKVSAVDWIEDQYHLKMKSDGQIHIDELNDIFNEARQMFQSQITDSWADGFHYDLPFANTEDYYKDTYGEQDSEQAD